MSVYLIAQLKIHDRSEYAKYEAGFMEIFESHGGTLRAVDEEPRVLEGEWPFTRTVLIEFPSEVAAMGWYESEAYQRLVQHRFTASDGNAVLLKGLGT